LTSSPYKRFVYTCNIRERERDRHLTVSSKTKSYVQLKTTSYYIIYTMKCSKTNDFTLLLLHYL